jgi:hypothetical protein
MTWVAPQAGDDGDIKVACGIAWWKRAQIAFNQRLGEARVAQLHAVIDDCLKALNAEAES